MNKLQECAHPIRISGFYRTHLVRHDPHGIVRRGYLHHPGHWITLQTDQAVQDFSSKKAQDQLLSQLLPDHIVQLIGSYHHQWCHVEMYLRLLNSGLVDSGIPRRNGEISVSQLEEDLYLHSLASFTLFNGREMFQVEPLNKSLSTSYAVLVENENVFLSPAGPCKPLSFYREASVRVHGVIRPVERQLKFLRALEAILHHFNHDGAMKSKYVPARSHLNRTSYEMVMILVKHYAKEILDEKIYWRVDPIRLHRAARIRAEIVDPAIRSLKVTDKILYPLIKSERVTTTEIVRVIDPKDVERERAINKAETEKMESEDFDAGKENMIKKYFYMKTVIIPPTSEDFVEYTVGEVIQEQAKPAQGSLVDMFRKKKKKAVKRIEKLRAAGECELAIKGMPTKAYIMPDSGQSAVRVVGAEKLARIRTFEEEEGRFKNKPREKEVLAPKFTYEEKYLRNRPHGIPTETMYLEKEIKNSSGRSWSEVAKSKTQEDWQNEANVNMARVLSETRKINLQERAEVLTKVCFRTMWTGRVDTEAKPLRPCRGAATHDFLVKKLSYARKKPDWNLKKNFVWKDMDNYHRKENDPETDPILQNRYNLRVLFHMMHEIGLRESCTLLRYGEMLTAIIATFTGRKIPALTQELMRKGSSYYRKRLIKQDRKGMRFLLAKLK